MAKRKLSVTVEENLVELLEKQPERARSQIVNLTLERHLDQTIAEWRQFMGMKEEAK